jgi:hypothetical protein
MPCGLLLSTVFLERYSSLLSSSDLDSFQPLRSNYEVNYWLDQAEQQQQQRRASGSGPQPAPELQQQQHAAECGSSRNKAANKTAANRRLAFMYKLEQQGEYFTESSMRAREPLVWHEYIGEAWRTVITRVMAILLYCTVVPLYGTAMCGLETLEMAGCCSLCGCGCYIHQQQVTVWRMPSKMANCLRATPVCMLLCRAV